MVFERIAIRGNLIVILKYAPTVKGKKDMANSTVACAEPKALKL